MGTRQSNISCAIPNSNRDIVTLSVLYLTVIGTYCSNIICAISDSNGNIVTLAVLYLIVMGSK